MRYSKNIYLDDDNPIDADIKSLPQSDLRNRLRTGHIIHEILNDLLASSLQDFINVEEEHRLEALLDTLQHHERMQKRMKKPGSSDGVGEKPVVDDRAGAPVAEVIEPAREEPVQEVEKKEDKAVKKIPCKFKSIPGM